MSERSDPRQEAREKLMGLGERSFHKSYYPELRKRVTDLELFRTLLDQAGDAILLIDAATGHIMDFNQTCLDLFGRSREKLDDAALADIFPAHALQTLEAVFNDADARTSMSLETAVIRPGGEAVPVELSLTLREIQDKRFAVAVARDISQRIQSQNQLKAAEEKYRSIFENAVEGIFQITPEGRFLSANPSMAALLGYASADEMLENVKDFSAQHYVGPHERHRLLEILEEYGYVSSYEVQLKRCGGKSIWVSFSSRVVQDGQGRIRYFEGFCTDVTKRKEAEEALSSLTWELERKVSERTRDLARKAAELERANENLREQDELKSAFFSAVSHELRTPLTSVLGFAKVIQKEFTRHIDSRCAQDPKLERVCRRIKDNLSIIVEEGARLTRLINDYLDLSKIESGRVEWRDQDIDVAQLLETARETVAGGFAEKPDVSLRLAPPQEPFAIHADPDRMLQVLINLLHNALKYTERGEVEMTAVNAGRGRVRITVRDTGVGVPGQDLKKIFNKFHQASRGDTIIGDAKGAGLGLALCREIVSHYKGRIWAESTVGQGSVFSVELPLAPLSGQV